MENGMRGNVVKEGLVRYEAREIEFARACDPRDALNVATVELIKYSQILVTFKICFTLLRFDSFGAEAAAEIRCRVKFDRIAFDFWTSYHHHHHHHYHWTFTIFFSLLVAVTIETQSIDKPGDGLRRTNFIRRFPFIFLRGIISCQFSTFVFS